MKMINDKTGRQSKQHGSGSGAQASQSSHRPDGALRKKVAWHGLYIADPCLEPKQHYADERQGRHRIVDPGSEYARRHQQRGQRNHCFSGFVHAPSASHAEAGGPAANHASRTSGNVGHPGKDPDLFQTETANIIEIKWQPDNVKPPDRISQETREHNRPYLAILQKLPPVWALPGGGKIAGSPNESVFFRREPGLLFRRLIKQEP